MAKPVDKDDKNPNKKPFELNSNLMMVIGNIIMAVIIIASMITMYFLLDSSFNKKLSKLVPEDEQGEIDEEEEEPTQEGVLLDLGDFILNLADPGHRRYLKIGIAMELSKTAAEVAAAEAPQKPAGGGHGHGEAPAPADPNEAIIAEMERYKPAIRDAIISVLSSKSSDELSTPVGKEIAKEEIQESVNGVFAGKRKVMRVSFGQFIIQ